MGSQWVTVGPVWVLMDPSGLIMGWPQDSEDSEASDSEEWGSSGSGTDSESDEEEGKYTSLASKFLKKSVPHGCPIAAP